MKILSNGVIVCCCYLDVGMITYFDHELDISVLFTDIYSYYRGDKTKRFYDRACRIDTELIRAVTPEGSQVFKGNNSYCVVE
jgi:hypothetical protein